LAKLFYKVTYRFFNDGDTFPELLFGDDQWRGKADDVAMGGFGEKSIVF
jgi:hypothetical protein